MSVSPGADRERAHALHDAVDEIVADVAHGDDGRDGHAALARGAEARVDGGVGREIEVGVGQHDHVVLRAAERLHALAGARARARRRTARSGVEPTNETAFTSGCSSRRSTATLSPCTTLKTPAGSPASAHSAASQFAADGSFSDGLSTTQLPVAIAIGKNQHGTIAGKLNGLITATTPSGWRTENTSTLRRHALGELALEHLRDAARELHHLEARVPPRRSRRSAPCRAPT